MLKHLSSIAGRILDAAEVLASAGRAAGAVERGGAPKADDLRRLGIRSYAFAAVRRN